MPVKVFVAFEASPWSSWDVIGVGSSREKAFECIDKHHAKLGHRSIYRIVECGIDDDPEPLQPMTTPEVKPRSKYVSSWKGDI